LCGGVCWGCVGASGWWCVDKKTRARQGKGGGVRGWVHKLRGDAESQNGQRGVLVENSPGGSLYDDEKKCGGDSWAGVEAG